MKQSEIEMFMLLSMLFCHIIDDYYVQGRLTYMKQKSWWNENAPDKMYKYDYIVALLIHSFSWSFMIMLPIIAYLVLYGLPLQTVFILPYIINTIIHAIIDDLKANKLKINLITDQSIHLFQIIVTWYVFVEL